MIEPEATLPAAPPRRRRRAVLAGVTVLALVAGGIAVAAGGGRREPAPLALVAGNSVGNGGIGEKSMAAPTAASGVAGGMASADSRSFAPGPYGGWGLTFNVDGALPSLPGHAAAWTVSGPALDRAAVARIAGALGLSGGPTQRDGGWFVDDGATATGAGGQAAGAGGQAAGGGGQAAGRGGWTLAAYPGGDTWSISYYRSFPTTADDAAAGGPALSGADAERRVRDLLDHMGAPDNAWKIETTETEIGAGWACASPGLSPEDLKKLEAEKLQGLTAQTPVATSPNQVAPASSGASTSSAGGTSSGSGTSAPAGAPSSVGTGSGGAATAGSAGSGGGGAAGSAGAAGRATPADKPAPDIAVAPCPAPPAPVKGFNVALYPVLDGHRADWPVWTVTVRSDGRVENLYGSWATFQRGGDYKLRGVDAALKELQSPPQILPAVGAGGIATDLPAFAPPATGSGAAAKAAGSAATPGAATGSVEPTPGARPVDGGGAVSTPGMVVPAIAPVCPPVAMPMPMPADKATSSFALGCTPPAPQVVTITGVELGLVQAPVFEGGRVRLHLVPAYRFLGHFDNGTPWETSVIALHPDAIAAPPNTPVADTTRETGIPAIGKAVPPDPARP